MWLLRPTNINSLYIVHVIHIGALGVRRVVLHEVDRLGDRLVQLEGALAAEGLLILQLNCIIGNLGKPLTVQLLLIFRELIVLLLAECVLLGEC